MPKLEFLYFEDCPSHEQALAMLLEVMSEQAINAPIEITQVETDAEAQQHRFYGSPTIRVNGVDIAPMPDDMPEPNISCRAYRRADGRITPLPPRDLIVAALQKASASH